MTRVITLPAIGKTITLKNYVVAVKRAKANPDRVFSHGFSSWWATTGKEIMGQFREGIYDRINQGIPYWKRGVEV